ncbi:MAG: hypothetical protein ABIA37_04540 [Candidatus Woesearchaeota archaeon]
MKTKQIPTGVKAISIFYYVSVGFMALAGLILMLGAGAFTQMTAELPFVNVLGALGSALFIGIAIVLLAIAVLVFFVARGLWKLQNWARITAIVFAALSILQNISFRPMMGGFSGNILSLAISGLIGGYLLFSKEVKKAFG